MKEIAEDIFKRHPKTDKVFITSDGQAFFDEAHAKNHAVPNKKRTAELDIESFRRNVEKVEDDTVKTIVKKINAAKTVEETEEILNIEKQREEPRKTVLEAANNQIKKLNA